MTHWLARGADGWRLDAAYAVPESFWAQVLPRVRRLYPEAWFVAEVIHDAVARQGLPAATFQLVHGGAAVGSQLAADPRVRAISFTGSTVTGNRIVQAAGLKKFSMELGGSLVGGQFNAEKSRRIAYGYIDFQLQAVAL